jgi:hypothetical protein
MNIRRFSLIASLASSFALPNANAQETATTDPVGFVTVGITAGTGTAKQNTLFSVPLIETQSITGQVAGTITEVTANTISNSNAGWQAGQLSDPASPYLIQITSGAAEGRMFLIASSSAAGGAIAGAPNTATSVTVSSVDAGQVDLTNLGINAGTDTYKIYACDTLSSFFGTPQTSGVLGGSTPANSDTLVLVVNGSSQTYFYRTSPSPARWTRVFGGSPDASNVPLVPYYGMQYARLGSTPLSFVVTGGVPTEPRRMAVKNSGVTLVSQFWPAESTLQSSGLSSVVTPGATPAVADTVILTVAGGARTYWFDGTNWRRVFGGSPISNSTPIPIGTTVQVNRKGTAAGFSTLLQQVPYTLN